MSDPELPVAAGLSQAARRFLLQAKRFEAPDVTLGNIQSVRAECRALYQPGIDAVLSRFHPDVSEQVIDGLRLQVVTPADYDPAHDHLALLYFFGGGFHTGSPEEDLRIMVPLAAKLGIRIFAPWYPLSPEQVYPAARELGIELYPRWLQYNHLTRTAVVGESAGGNLALQTVLGHLVRDTPAPVAVGLLSPWSDLTHDGDSHRLLDGVDPTLNHAFVCAMARGYSAGEDLADPGISPLFSPYDEHFPPTWISSGTRDLLMSDAVRLSTRLRTAGVKVDLQIREGLWHVFEFYPELPEADHSLGQLAAFLQEHLVI